MVVLIAFACELLLVLLVSTILMLGEGGATGRIDLFYYGSVMSLVRLITLAVVYCAKIFCVRFHSAVSLYMIKHGCLEVFCIGAGQPGADELDVWDKILSCQMWISGLGVEVKDTTKRCSCVSNLEPMIAIFSVHCLELLDTVSII